MRMVIARISEYFEYQMKNGKMRIINSRTAAVTFLSYIGHMSQIRGVISDDILGFVSRDLPQSNYV